ncbi:hypothetical protein [Halopenitus persicus]|uniref:hypothetical protein n=1 Tax=Halopenitus persicus TaxID=1048396 RepID=UPI000BBA7EF1|nr:hypothetical protein [Halopenitus persicus]
MRVRDAVEADAEAIAALAEQPVDATREVIHDRSVRVAIPEEPTSSREEPTSSREEPTSSREEPTSNPERPDPESPTDAESTAPTGSEPTNPTAYVAFDAHREAVHLTGFGGEKAALERLLEEPRRFADREGMAVEAIVDRDDDERRSIVESVGFEETGAGPRFDGSETVRYRIPRSE